MESVYSNSINSDVFCCGDCKTVFTSLLLFLDHKKKPCFIDNEIKKDPHTRNDVYNLLNSDSPNLETDISNLRCSTCLKTFKKLKSLEVHRKIHTGERAFQCPICGRCFIQSTHLQRHLQCHKSWPNGLPCSTTPKSTSVDLLSYSCPHCEQILSNYHQFRVHLKKHSDLKLYKCIQFECICFFDSLEELLRHVDLSHKHATYQCHLCPNVYTSLREIAFHQQEHKDKVASQAKKFKCTHCDSTFTKKSTLILHMSRDDHKKTCIHCNKTFVSDKRLRLHLQIHSTVKPFKCKICGLSFTLKKYLSTHLLKHGERQFVCTVCGFKFKRRDLLSRHSRTHQTIKKFHCPYKESLGCNLEFSRNDKLKRHITSHGNSIENSVPDQKKTSALCQSSTLEILILPMNLS